MFVSKGAAGRGSQKLACSPAPHLWSFEHCQGSLNKSKARNSSLALRGVTQPHPQSHDHMGQLTCVSIEGCIREVESLEKKWRDMKR